MRVNASNTYRANIQLGDKFTLASFAPIVRFNWAVENEKRARLSDASGAYSGSGLSQSKPSWSSFSFGA